ncbi:golgin subfamily A member 4-like [Hydractinia symbiolongicarpus]|uniref:golgin subfamily A member 4-like n=1 Tax=Hydractinia symbiolongicarpus TaxID=13093 RepID=UPI0025504ABD|nr:golgin subfamily A member 4-like [Hydractinia symbiolongicarpus]
MDRPFKRRKGKSLDGGGAGFAMPLTERQQMAYLLSMTAKEGKNDDSGEDIQEAKKVRKLSPLSRINRPKNKSGETQLHIAATKGDLEATKNLIRQGADVNCRDNADWTPLHEACNHGHYKVAKVLLRSGAHVNVAGLDGDTPLHDASANAHLKVVLLLLRHGANPHQKNDAGESPIDVADGKDIDEALRNFTSEMLLDLKPTKDFTLEAQKSKYRHSETSGKTDKPSHSGAVKTHRRLISNKADFLDADNIEDFEELSTTSSDISKHNTFREEAATEKKTEKMQADIRTGKFEEKKEKLHEQGKQTEKRHKKLDKPDSFDKKVLLTHTNRETKHLDGHKKKHHKHDKIPSRDIEQKSPSESPDKWKQRNRLNLKDFVLSEDNDIPNRLIEEHPGKYMKDMKHEDRVKVLKDSSQNRVDNERKERKEHEFKIKKDKKLHTTKHPDKIQKKKEPSTPKKKNNLVRVKGFLDDSDDEEPQQLKSFQLIKTESPQEKVCQESAIGTKIEINSSLKDEFIGKNLISRSEQQDELVKHEELKVKNIPTKAKLKHMPSDILEKKEQPHQGEVETLSFSSAFDSESITSHSRHDKPYLHPTLKQHEVKKNLFSSKQSEAIKQIPAKKQRDLNKETTSAKSKDASRDSLAPEQKTKIDEPRKTSLAHDKGLLNKIKTTSLKHGCESYGNDIVKQKESNIEECRDDLKNVLLPSHKDLTTKPKHKEGKSVHFTKKENSPLSTPHKDGSLLKVKPKKEMNSTATASTVTIQPIRKEHKQLLHSESKRKEHMDQELDSTRDVNKDSNSKSNMHKTTSSVSKHTSKQTESSPAKGSHTATPQKQHDELNAFYHSHQHKSSVPGQVEINLFSSVEKSAKKSSKHSERKHKFNDTKISPYGTVFKKVSKKLKVDDASADKEEHGKKQGAAQTHSIKQNDSPDTILVNKKFPNFTAYQSEDTLKEKKKGGDIIVKHHKKHKDKSKDVLKDKKKTSELSALSTEQQDYLKSKKHSNKYSILQKSFKQENKLMSETKAENKCIKEESGTFENLSINTKADTLSHVKNPDFYHAFKESPTDNKTEKKTYLDSDDIIMSTPTSSKPQKIKIECGFEPKIVEIDKKIVLTQKTSAQVKSNSENSVTCKTDDIEKQEKKPPVEEGKKSNQKQHTEDTEKSASATMEVTVHEHILTCGPKHKHKLLHHVPNKESAIDTVKKKHKRKSTESDTYINKVKKRDLQEASKPVPLKEPLKESLSLPSALSTNLENNSAQIKSANSVKRDRSRSLENVAAKDESKPSELTTCQKMVIQKALESASSEPNKAGSSEEFKTNIVDLVLPVDKNLRKKDTVSKKNSKKDEDEVVHKGIRLKEVDLNMKVGLNDNALRGLDNIKKKKKKRSSDNKDTSVECKISKLLPELIKTDSKINTVSSNSSHEIIKNVPLGSNHNKNSRRERNASQVDNLEKKTHKTLPSEKEKVREDKYLKSSIDTAKAIHLSAKVQPKVVVGNLQLTMPEEKHDGDASDNLEQQQQKNHQLQQQLLLKEQEEQRKQQEKQEQLKEIQQEEQIRNENLMYEENEDAVENLLHMEDPFGTDSAFENEVKPNSPTMLFNSNAFVVPSNSNVLSQDVDDGISEDSSSEKIIMPKEITKVVERTNLSMTTNETCIKKTYDNISSPEQISTMQHLHPTDLVVHNTMTQNVTVASILPEVESSVLKVNNNLYQVQQQEQPQTLQQQNKNEPQETMLPMKDQSQEQFLPQWKHSNPQLVLGQSKYIQAEQDLFSDQVQLSIYKQLQEKQERLFEKNEDQQSQLPAQLLKQQHIIEQEQDITGKFQHLENWELQELQHVQGQFSEKSQNQQFVEKKQYYEWEYEKQQQQQKDFSQQQQQLAKQQPKLQQLVKQEQRQQHFRVHEHKQDPLGKHQYLSEQQKTLQTGKQQREHLFAEKQKQWNAAEQQLKQQLLLKQQQKKHLKDQQQKQRFAEEQQKQHQIAEKQKQRLLTEQQKQHLVKEQQKRQKVVEHQQHLSKEQQKQQLIAEKQQNQQLLAKEQRKQQLLAKEQRKKQLLDDEQQKQQKLAEQQKQQLLAEQHKQLQLAEHQKQEQLAEKQKQLLAEQQQKQRHLVNEQRKQQLFAEQQQKQQHLAEQQQKQQRLVEEQRKQQLLAKQKQLLAEQQKQLLVEQQKKQQRLVEQQQKKLLAEQLQKQQLLAEQQQKHQLLAEQQQKQHLAEQQEKRQLLAEQQQKQQRLMKQQQQHFLLEQQKEQLIAEQQKQLQLAEQQKQQKLAEQQKQLLAEQQQKQQRLADEQRKQKLFVEQQQKQQELAEQQQKQQKLAEKQQKQQLLAEQQKNQLLAEQQKKQHLAVQQQKQQHLAVQQQKQQHLAVQQQKQQLLAEQQQKQHFLVKQQKEQVPAEQQKQLQPAEHKQQQLEEQHKKQHHFVDHAQKQQAPFKKQQKQNDHAEVQKNQEHFSKQQEELHSVKHKQKEQPNLGKHKKQAFSEIQKGNMVSYNPAPDEHQIKQKKQDFVQQQQKQKQIEQHHLEEQHQKQEQFAKQKQKQQDFPEKQQDQSHQSILADHKLREQPILSEMQNKEHSKKHQKQNLLSDKQKQQQPAEQHQKQLQFTEQQKQQQLLEDHSAEQQHQTFELKCRKQQWQTAGSQVQLQQQKSEQDLKETLKLEHAEKLKAEDQPQHPSCVKQEKKLPELKHEETKEGVSVQQQVTEKQMPQIQRLESEKQYEKEKRQKEEQSQKNNIETKIVHTKESSSKKPAIKKQLPDIPKQEIVNSDVSFTSKQLKKESDAKENTDQDDQKHAFNKLELSTHFNKNEEFSGLVSPSTDADHVLFANRYHDLDAIDASDLLKTEKHSDELIATSFKDQTHLHDSAIVGISRCLSSEEIISKVADCILELDEHDNTFTLRQYIPVQSTTSGNRQQDNILPSVVTSSLSCSESCSNLTVSQVFHHGANEFNKYSHDAPVFEEAKYADNHGKQPAPVVDQHVTEPLFVNTVSARLSSSEEKLYSPKHISDGEKLYSPRTSVSSDDGKRYRKVNLEPCDMLRTLINSDLSVVPPQVPIQETKKNETNETQQSVIASPVRTRNSSAVVKTDKKPAAVKTLQTWREAVKSQCSVISMNDYQRNVDSILASVLKPKKYEDILKEAGDNKQLQDLLMQHASQLEKLKISMIQELSRVESNCRLLSQEKGPVGAATVIYFQRDHASRNLGRTLNFTNKATHMPDIEKLRDARLADLQDKYEKMMKTILSQHRLEVDTLKQTQKMDTLLDQQEMLRQRYMRLRYKINR